MILDPPNLLSGLANRITNESDTLKLHCNYTGVPSPSIVWYRNVSNSFEILQNTGDRIRIVEIKSEEEGVTNSNIDIFNVTIQDDGIYRCQGVNNIPNLIDAKESTEASITIHGKLN